MDNGGTFKGKFFNFISKFWKILWFETNLEVGPQKESFLG